MARIWTARQVTASDTRSWASRHWLTPTEDSELPGEQFEGRIATWPTVRESLLAGRSLRGASENDTASFELVNIDGGVSGLDVLDRALELRQGLVSGDGYGGLDTMFQGVTTEYAGSRDGRRVSVAGKTVAKFYDRQMARRRLKGYGYALSFTNGQITWSYVPAPTTQLIAEVVVRPSSITGTQVIVSVPGMFQIRTVSGVANHFVTTSLGNAVVSGGSALTIGGTYRLTLWWEQTSGSTSVVRSYIDDALIAETAIAAGSLSAGSVGTLISGNSSFRYKGRADDLRVWVDAARTEADYLRSWDGPLPADDRSGLALYAPMDEGTGTVTYDVVAGLAGTITSGTWVDTRTGGAELAGTSMPIALGVVPQCAGIQVGERSWLFADDDAHVDEVSIGGRRLAPATFSSMSAATFEAARKLIKPGPGDDDLRSLAIGQLLVVSGTPSGTNDGTYTVAAMPADIGNLGVPGGPPTQLAICVEEAVTDQASVAAFVAAVAPTEVSATNISFTAPSTITSGTSAFGSLVPGQTFTVVDAAGGGANDGTYTVASATGTTITTVETSITTQAAGPTIEITALEGTAEWEKVGSVEETIVDLYAPTSLPVRAALRGRADDFVDRPGDLLDVLHTVFAAQAAGTIDATALAALDADRDGSHGHYTPAGSDETVRMVFDRIAQGAGAVWGVEMSTGKVVVDVLADPATEEPDDTTVTIESHQILAFERSETIEAFDGVEVLFRKNSAPLSEGDLLAAVAEDATTYGEQRRSELREEWQTATAGDVGGEHVDRIHSYTTSRAVAQAIASETFSRDGSERAYYVATMRTNDAPALRRTRCWLTYSRHADTANGKWLRPVLRETIDGHRTRVTFWG